MNALTDWDRDFFKANPPKRGKPPPREYLMYDASQRIREPTNDLDDYGTPPWLFDILSREFRFTLDACATRENTMVPRNFITPAQDALRTSWMSRSRGGAVWCNPPYGWRLRDWMRKAYAESRKTLVVCLVPAKPGQQFWWDYVIRGQVRFLKSTLKYTRGGVEMRQAPFPSAVVVLGPKVKPAVRWWDAKLDADV